MLEQTTKSPAKGRTLTAREQVERHLANKEYEEAITLARNDNLATKNSTFGALRVELMMREACGHYIRNEEWVKTAFAYENAITSMVDRKAINEEQLGRLRAENRNNQLRGFLQILEFGVIEKGESFAAYFHLGEKEKHKRALVAAEYHLVNGNEEKFEKLAKIYQFTQEEREDVILKAFGSCLVNGEIDRARRIELRHMPEDKEDKRECIIQVFGIHISKRNNDMVERMLVLYKLKPVEILRISLDAQADKSAPEAAYIRSYIDKLIKTAEKAGLVR